MYKLSLLSTNTLNTKLWLARTNLQSPSVSFPYITERLTSTPLDTVSHYNIALSGMAAKQSSLILSKKIEILAAVEKNERDKKTTKTKIAQTFGIAKTMLSTILKTKTSLKKHSTSPSLN